MWKPEYKKLRCYNNDISENDIELVIKLKKELYEHYNRIEFTRKEDGLRINPTDTLLTKIILGTLGCIPAYDRFFKLGLSEYEICQQANKKSMKELFKFVKSGNNERLIKEVQNDLVKKKVFYPTMKILDMYFWSIGYKIDLERHSK